MSATFYIIMRRDMSGPGSWHSVRPLPPPPHDDRPKPIECVEAFTSESDAWRFLLGDAPSDPHVRSVRSAWRAVKFEAERAVTGPIQHVAIKHLGKVWSLPWS